MSEPQAGIFVEGSHSHFFLEYKLIDGVSTAQLKEALAKAIALSEGGVNKVWAFGADCWRSIAPGVCPADLKPFAAVGEGKRIAPATQQSILLWVHGENHSANFDAAMAASTALASVAILRLEKIGFLYKDSRDLSGFIDGTENPTGRGQQLVALIPEGEAGAGGSFVLSQQWVHNLSSFHALSQSEQEAVIGRTKPDSIELDDEHMPENSHVSRSDVKINGVSQKLYRRSVPYGGVLEHGLYFLAFSCDIRRFDHILQSMFGVSGDGIHDHLTDFSTPVTGNYWFAPSADELSAIGSL
ncbi:Dyp-type peroxidase [uncultured Zhongshania sp.]|uniref:Dyp-type peroxidase n=1 Tax=uncultured Zhongshania sp. TaxID=1642288 RepID=UPI0030DD41AB|tara:strand:+ start:1050 stop:1946 length:897 start_codon:yes stop_codon:yes gene_type:complete